MSKRIIKRSKRALKSRDLKKDHGITIETYECMLRDQDYKCAICFKQETATHLNGRLKMLCVDHDHATNKIRGLLCNRCNSALGYIYESFDTAMNMAKYIMKHKDVV